MKIFAVVTCMGRLHHIKRTAPRVMRDHRFSYVLSDYNCPNKTGDWLSAHYPTAHVIKTTAPLRNGKAIFKKVAALNAGARHAILLGADYLCFLDADTLVNPGFHEWVADNIGYDRFLIAPSLYDQQPKTREISGFVCVHRDHYLSVGGFDPQMEGWGGDDLELRVKLYCQAGLKWRYIPLPLLDPIQHGDEERIKYHVALHREESNLRNLSFVVEAFRKATGQLPIDMINTDVGKGFYELTGVDREYCLKILSNKPSSDVDT